MLSKFKVIFKGGSSVKRKKIYHNVRVEDPDEVWTIKGEIGDGAYGKVYKAEHIINGTQAALKKVALEEEDDLDNFMVEIDILAECQHPNIVGLLEAYHWEGCLWMYLEYCDGGAVDSIMVDLDRPLTEPQIAYISYHLLRALDYIHQNKVIHRDLKAGNVLLTTEGGVKLADFGVSAKNKNTLDKRGTFIGTPYWLAPEVIKCETFIDSKYDYKADIWSLGITLIEFAQMDPPNHEVSPLRVLLKIQKSDPPKLDCPSKFSKEFNAFIAACLVKEPEERPDARDLLQHPFVSGSQNAKHIIALLIEYQADVVEEDVDDDNASRMSLESEDPGSSSADVSVASSDGTAARHHKEVTPTGVTERRQSKGPAPPPPGHQRKGPAPSVPSPATTPVTTPASVPFSASSTPAAVPATTPVHTTVELSKLPSSTSVTAIASLSSATVTATSVVTTPTSLVVVTSEKNTGSVTTSSVTSEKDTRIVTDDSHAPLPPVVTLGPSASPVSITSIGTSKTQSAVPVTTPSQTVASTPVTSTPIKDSNSGKEDAEAFNKSHPASTSTTTVTIASDGVADDSAYVTVPASPADTLVNPVASSGVSVSGDAPASSVVSSVVSVSNSDSLALSDAPASLALTALSPTSFVTSSQDVSMVSITTLGDSRDNFGNDSTLVIGEKQEVREDPAVSGEINQRVVVESTSKTQIVAEALDDLQDSHVVASSTVVSVKDSCQVDLPAIVSANNSASALPTMTSPTIVVTDHHSFSEADISSSQSSSPTPAEDISPSITSGRRSAEDRQRSPDSLQQSTPDLDLPGVVVDDDISSPLRGSTTSSPDYVDAPADAVRPVSSPPPAQIIASIGSEGTVIVRTPTPTSLSPTAQLDAAQQLANQSVVTFSGPGVVDSNSITPDQSPHNTSPQVDVGHPSLSCHGVLDFTLAEEEAVQLLDDVIDHHANDGKDSFTSLDYSATVSTVNTPPTDAPAVCLATVPAGGSHVVVLDAVKETHDEVVVVSSAVVADRTDQVVISNSSILEGESNTDDVPVPSSLASVKPGQAVSSPHISVVSVPKGADAGNTCVTIEGTTLGDTDVDSIVLTTREEDTVDRSSLSQLRPAVLTNGRENAGTAGPGRKAAVEDRSDSDSVSTVSSEKENSKPRHGGSTSGEDDVVQLRRQTGRTVSADTSSVSLASSGTGPGSRSAHSLSMNSEVLHEDASLLRPVDRNRQNRQTNLMRNGRTKEENDSLALRKKTRKRTRKFMIDGVVVTTTTSKVIYGDDEDCILIPSGHHARKLELRELKILQKQEQKQFQELGIKASVARQEQERKFETERTQLVRSYDNDVDLLNRHQKQQVERTEAQHEIELKSSSKKIRTDQEKELRLFRDSLKTELKLLKQEVDLQPKDIRKEVLRSRKEHLEADQAEREKSFLERLHQNHESSMKRLSEEHRSHVALLERQFLQKKHQLLRAREAALWELEERHLHDRHQLAKRQLKDIFFLQRHQMLLRHEKELEQVRRQNTQREEDLVKRQQVERRSMPKRIRQEMKARELMFRESMRISTTNLPDSHHDEKERLRKFQECEKRRYEAEKRRHEQKHKRQLEELQAATEAHAKELEQMQNEKRKMLMEHETIKLKAQDEDYHKELREWKNNLKPRKQKLEDEFEQQLLEQEQFYGAYLTATSGGLLTAAGPDTAR